MIVPTSSHTSAPSKQPIATSKSSLPSFLTQGIFSLNNNVFRDWFINDMSLSDIRVICFTNGIALVKERPKTAKAATKQLKQLPKSISKGLSDLSSNKEIFEKTKPA